MAPALNRTRRRWRVAAVAALGLLAVVVVTPTAAQASTTLVYIFESPGSAGDFYHEGNGGGELRLREPDRAYSGGGYAHLYSSTGWSAVERRVSPGPGSFCSAQVYARALSGPARVSLAIINPTSWTYISVRTVNLSPTGSYHPVGPATWWFGPAEVHIRISLSGSGVTAPAHAYVDQLTVSCF